MGATVTRSVVQSNRAASTPEGPMSLNLRIDLDGQASLAVNPIPWPIFGYGGAEFSINTQDWNSPTKMSRISSIEIIAMLNPSPISSTDTTKYIYPPLVFWCPDTQQEYHVGSDLLLTASDYTDISKAPSVIVKQAFNVSTNLTAMFMYYRNIVTGFANYTLGRADISISNYEVQPYKFVNLFYPVSTNGGPA